MSKEELRGKLVKLFEEPQRLESPVERAARVNEAMALFEEYLANDQQPKRRTIVKDYTEEMWRSDVQDIVDAIWIQEADPSDEQGAANALTKLQNVVAYAGKYGPIV